MSGVYIPNFSMPTGWMNCPFAEEFANCTLDKSLAVCGIKNGTCPLVPVPKHGRLIDADALAEHKFVCIPHVTINGKEAGNAYRLGWNTAIEAIMENAETIIGGE